MFGFEPIVKPMNEAEVTYNDNKKFADKFAEALYRMRNEKDPIKRQKMNCRLALGITDFNDL